MWDTLEVWDTLAVSYTLEVFCTCVTDMFNFILSLSTSDLYRNAKRTPARVS